MCEQCFDEARTNNLDAANDYRTSCVNRSTNLAKLVFEKLKNKNCL